MDKKFKLLESHIIKCGFCSRKLLEVDKIQTNETRKILGMEETTSIISVTKCYHCNGKSLQKVRIEGTSHISPINCDYDIVDTIDREDAIEYIIETKGKNV